MDKWLFVGWTWLKSRLAQRSSEGHEVRFRHAVIESDGASLGSDQTTMRFIENKTDTVCFHQHREKETKFFAKHQSKASRRLLVSMETSGLLTSIQNRQSVNHRLQQKILMEGWSISRPVHVR